MRPRVLIGPSSFAALDKSPLKALQDAGFEVVNNPFGRKLTAAELGPLLEGVSGLIAGLETLDRKVMESSKLKVISRCGSGLSNVDVKAAEDLGIKVFSTPFGPTTAVAEVTLGALLSLLRMLPQMDRALHQKRWEKRIGSQLKGRTAVIVGFGRIGQKVGKLLHAFEAEVVAVDPCLDGAAADGAMTMCFDEALKRADIIILHCSGDSALIGKDEFACMKDGVYLLNAARGGLIDEDALIDALDSGKVAGAWLDTFSEEPYNGPLCAYEQVILTPHIGSYTFECRKQMESETVDNLIKGLQG